MKGLESGSPFGAICPTSWMVDRNGGSKNDCSLARGMMKHRGNGFQRDGQRPRRTVAVPLLILPLLIAGCAGRSEGIVQWSPTGRSWPPPPERPRVRFLGQIAGEIEAARARNFWSELFYGPPPSPRMITPQAVAVDERGNRVAVADANAGGVHLFDLNTDGYEFLSDRPETDSLLHTPVALVWHGAVLYVADAGAGCVIAFDDEGSLTAIGKGELIRPAGIAVDGQGDTILVSDSAAHQVVQFSFDGRLRGRLGRRGSGLAEFNFPTHLACAPNGDLVVSDSLNFRIQRIAPDGTLLRSFGQKGDAGGDFALPKGVGVDGDGNIWVVDAQFENVQAFNEEGALLMAFGGEGHDPGEFWLPAGLAIDANNRMWIADTYNRRIQIFELLR